MEVIKTCDELLAHLFQSYGDCKYSCGGYIEFQKTLCEIGGFMPSRWCILMPSIKFPKTVFAINDDCEVYDYLNDDINLLANPDLSKLGLHHKMPEQLVDDLKNLDL